MNKVPNTYVNKEGQHVEVGSHRILRSKGDGSIDKNQFNKGNLTPEMGVTNLDKLNTKMKLANVYTGDDSSENWNKFFEYLTKHPMSLHKAAAIAAFTARGARLHMGLDKELKQRYDDIVDAEVDNLEENIRDIAYEPDKKHLPTKLRANETMLNAHAKDRGYGIRAGLNIERSNVQINIINNSGSSLPGQEPPEEIETEEVK